MARKKAAAFSAAKAVRANARARLGQPKPSRPIVDRPIASERKHKETLVKLLEPREE